MCIVLQIYQDVIIIVSTSLQLFIGLLQLLIISLSVPNALTVINRFKLYIILLSFAGTHLRIYLRFLDNPFCLAEMFGTKKYKIDGQLWRESFREGIA